MEISLNSPDAKSQIQSLIKETIGLREELPQNFEDLVREAESLVNVGNNIQALAKYKELARICAVNRDLERGKIFQTKIDEINEKIIKLTEKRRNIETSIDFDTPKQLKFKKKISVKPLPLSVPAIETLAQEKDIESIMLDFPEKFFPNMPTMPSKLSKLMLLPSP